MGSLFDIVLSGAIRGGDQGGIPGSVGLITGAKQAEAILQDGKADVVSLVRELLRPLNFA